MSVSVLMKNSCRTHGEGPHWDDKTQSLLYVDIHVGEVHNFNTVTGQDSKIVLGDIVGDTAENNTVGFVVPRKAGGYVVGLNKSLTILDWDKAQLTPIATVDEDAKNHFNDAKCDASGRLWAGTMEPAEPLNEPKSFLANLYSLEKDRRLIKRLPSCSISNGLAWTKDNRTMFYIDSIPRQVCAFDFDMQSGDISNRRIVADWSKTDLLDMGFPDGMTIDQDGKLWIASFFGAKVVQMDPETGTILRQVDFPARRITSCCFGGPNYEDLFVTCSSHQLREEEQTAYPLSGSVFKVNGLGVKGCPAFEYGG